MNGLRKFTDKIKPSFEKGGKFGWLHSTFEAFESFMFVPKTVTTRGSHVRDSVDLKRVMIIVVIALLPCFFFGMWNVGFQHFNAIGENAPGFWKILGYGFLKILPLYLVSYIVGLGIEFASAQINGHQVNEGYLVTGMIIPLIVPVTVPLWQLALAVIFAVIIGKEVFGGTGMNIWNPALLARAFLFFSYPKSMTGDVWVAIGKNASAIDGFTGATPLALTAGGVDNLGYSFADMFFGIMPGAVGETSTLCILIGAAILIFAGVGSWKIMLSAVCGGLFVGLLGNVFAPSAESALAIPAYYQLVMGGFAFGAVFMATDPVTSAQTETGKWIYGFLVGSMAVIIRLFNPGYPEGMMLAILLMNAAAPLIDHIVVSRNIKRRLNRAKTI